MLNSGKKIRALRDKKNKYSNSCVVRKRTKQKNLNPSPLQVKWSVPYILSG
jgi:DNA-directed RNA polymerase subunit K/omega